MNVFRTRALTHRKLDVNCQRLVEFYPPKGLRKQYRRWSNCFYFMFYFVLGNVYWTFFSGAVIRLFEILKMFDLRVGWGIKSVLQFSLYFVCI